MKIDTVDISKSLYDTLATKIVEPNRIGVRFLESSVMATGLESKDLTVITPKDYKLKQNYPNPFNPETSIEFILPVKKKITLTIYNSIGQKVKTLINDQIYSPGSHTMQWNGTNEAGNKVATGMYIYELKFGNFSKSKRMMLIK
jgi:flagellar hook assembly protein FlgD